MNIAAVSGRLARDVQVRYTQDNTPVAQGTIAVDNGKKTAFINFRAWDKQAEWLEKWTHKGSRVELAGYIDSGSYDNKQGGKTYYTELVVQRANFGETKAEAQAREQDGAADTQADAAGFMPIPDGIDDELPFN